MTSKARPRTANPSALPWRRARQSVQLIALLAFLMLLITTRGGEFPSIGGAGPRLLFGLPANIEQFQPDSTRIVALPHLFFPLDPLAMVASAIAGRRWVDGLALALVTLGLTLVAGRVWCGWICPLGTTLDLIRPRRRKSPRVEKAPVSERWRSVKYIVLVGSLGAALAGNLT